MLPEDEKEKRDANDAPPETAAQTSTGPQYGSLIEYPKDAPARSGEALVLEDESASIDQKLAAASTEPGIYLLRDRAGKVLYVGKAKSLRTRVRAYFREGGDGRFQVRFLMKRVRDFDTIVT
ncbi:GIY-YIG nuclease family protein, partial [Candidatus Binatus sp.]